MASNPSDFTNPEVPTTMREFYMLYWADRHNLNLKLDDIKSSQMESDDMLADYMQKTNDWIKCHDQGLLQREKLAERHGEKIDQLEKKVNSWNILNSLGALIAAILAALGLKWS